jgi:adenylate cyclase class IV
MDSYEVEVKYEVSKEAYGWLSLLLSSNPTARFISSRDSFWKMPGSADLLRLRQGEGAIELTTKKVLDEAGHVRRENEVVTNQSWEEVSNFIKDLGGKWQFDVLKHAWIADMGFSVTTYEALVNNGDVSVRYFFEVEYHKELAQRGYAAHTVAGLVKMSFADYATETIVPRLEMLAHALLDGGKYEGTAKPQPKLLWQIFEEDLNGQSI